MHGFPQQATFERIISAKIRFGAVSVHSDLIRPHVTEPDNGREKTDFNKPAPVIIGEDGNSKKTSKIKKSFPKIETATSTPQCLITYLRDITFQR